MLAYKGLATGSSLSRRGRRRRTGVERSVAGTRWTWKKVMVVVDSGAAENVMPRSMFP